MKRQTMLVCDCLIGELDTMKLEKKEETRRIKEKIDKRGECRNTVGERRGMGDGCHQEVPAQHPNLS